MLLPLLLDNLLEAGTSQTAGAAAGTSTAAAVGSSTAQAVGSAAGTSTAASAIVSIYGNFYLREIAKTGSWSYTLIGIWELDTNNDLVAQSRGELGLVHNDGTWDEANFFANAVANATYYRELSALPADRHNGTETTGTALTSGIVSESPVRYGNEDYFRCTWLRITDWATGHPGVAHDGTCDFGMLSHCILHDGPSGQAAISLEEASKTFLIRNCIIYNMSGPALTITATNVTVYLHNCTIWNVSQDNVSPAVGFASGATGSLYVRNCTIHSATAQPALQGQASGTIYVKNSAVSDSSITDESTVADQGQNYEDVVQADQFVNLTGGSEDLHLKAGADLLSRGRDLSSDPDLPVTTDIDNDSRVGLAFDIGAHQLGTLVPAYALIGPAGMSAPLRTLIVR